MIESFILHVCFCRYSQAYPFPFFISYFASVILLYLRRWAVSKTMVEFGGLTVKKFLEFIHCVALRSFLFLRAPYDCGGTFHQLEFSSRTKRTWAFVLMFMSVVIFPHGTQLKLYKCILLHQKKENFNAISVLDHFQPTGAPQLACMCVPGVLCRAKS